MALKNISGQPSNAVIAPQTGDAGQAKSVNKADKIHDAAKLAANGQASKGVDVAVSDAAKTRAQEIKKAKELAMKAPDVREDKVAALKAKIAAGSYEVDSQKIADGMVRESMMEHLAADWNQ